MIFNYSAKDAPSAHTFFRVMQKGSSWTGFNAKDLLFFKIIKFQPKNGLLVTFDACFIQKKLKILQPNCTSVSTQPSKRQRRQKSGDIEYDRSGAQ